MASTVVLDLESTISKVVTLLLFMFVLVVASLVTVPEHHWGDLAHTTMSCTLFLACPLPWMGHLVVRTGIGRVLLTGSLLVCVFCRINKSNCALQTCMSSLYFRVGVLFKLELVWFWISSGNILFSMTLDWVVRAVNIWASLGGGPVCILVIEFSFTKKLTRIPGGGGQQGLWANFREMGGQPLGDLSRVSTGSAVNDLLQGVLQGFLGAL